MTVNGGTLKYDMVGRTAALGGPFVVNSNGTLELSNTNATIDNATGLIGNATSTPFTGAGTINKTGAGYASFFGANANLSGFTGTINVVDGTLASNGATWGTGTATLNIAATKTFDLRVGTVSVDKLTGLGTIGSSFTANAALRVGGQGGSSTFDGVIQNTVTGFTNAPSIALTKVGAGTFTLTNANTYTGGTAVSNGVLLVHNTSNSATGTGSVSVGSTGTLGGNGSINVTAGTINIISGGKVMVGDTTNVFPALAGQKLTLNSSGAVTMGGTLQFDIFSRITSPTFGGNLTNPTNTNDLLSFNHLVDLNSTTSALEVYTTGALASTFVSGDKWKLIDWATTFQNTNSTGSFNSSLFVLPTLNSLYTWDVYTTQTNFLTTGQITVVDAVPEPSRAILMLFGAAGLLLRRRRKAV